MWHDPPSGEMVLAVVATLVAGFTFARMLCLSDRVARLERIRDDDRVLIGEELSDLLARLNAVEFRVPPETHPYDLRVIRNGTPTVLRYRNDDGPDGGGAA